MNSKNLALIKPILHKSISVDEDAPEAGAKKVFN